MTFLTFQLIFAGFALSLIVAIVLLIRQLRRKRADKAPATKPARREAQAAAPARRGLGRRKPAEPEPVAEGPPPARRRQLASFVEHERTIAEAEAQTVPELPGADAPSAGRQQPEPLPETWLAAEPAVVVAIDDEACDEPEPAYAGEFDQAVLGRLETAFEAYQGGEISLDTYRHRVGAEAEAVEQHIAIHRATGDEIELEAALAARESVRWCLDWADEQQNAKT